MTEQSRKWTDQVTPLREHHATLSAMRAAGDNWRRMSRFGRASCVQEAAIRLGYYKPSALRTEPRTQD